MKNVKLASIISGVGLLIASLAPISASALSVGSMTMEGAYSSDGHFSVIVYENTGADTVTGAAVQLTFSQPVTNVSYDYSVGPFTAVDYSGAHNALGAVSGRNALARVNFTLPNPGTVIADVSASGSYLWHVEGASVQDIAFEKGEAHFTYTAPAPQQPAAAPTTTSSTSSNASASSSATASPAPTPTDTPAALSTATDDHKNKQEDAAKVAKKSHVGVISSTVSVLLVLAAAAAYWLLIHKRTEVAPAAKTYKLAEAAAKQKTTKKKPSAKKK